MKARKNKKDNTEKNFAPKVTGNSIFLGESVGSLKTHPYSRLRCQWLRVKAEEQCIVPVIQSSFNIERLLSPAKFKSLFLAEEKSGQDE